MDTSLITDFSVVDVWMTLVIFAGIVASFVAFLAVFHFFDDEK